MSKKIVAVLDVGSSSVKAVVSERGVNNTFSIKSEVAVPYEGFAEGQFFDLQELSDVISDAVMGAFDKAGKKFKEIYVGVPGAFIEVENKKIKNSFGKQKKVRQVDIDELFERGKKFAQREGYQIISATERNFVLDESRVVENPVGVVSSIIAAPVTYVLCENYFIDTITKILNDLGVSDINFVYSGQSEGRYLIEREERETPSVIIDVGYITSDISIHHGNSIIAKSSCDFGGGMLTFTIVQGFDLMPDIAEDLKRKVNLGYSNDEDDVYTVATENGVVELSTYEVNEKIVECVDTYVGDVCEFLESKKSIIGEEYQLYLTGGGISYLKGIKTYFLTRFGLPVEILSPKVPFFNKPSESSKFALLDYALKDKEKKSKQFLLF